MQTSKRRRLKKEVLRRDGVLDILPCGTRYYIGVCYICDAIKIGTQLTLDHIIPLYQGGEDAISNLALACKECNEARNPHHRNKGILPPKRIKI